MEDQKKATRVAFLVAFLRLAFWVGLEGGLIGLETFFEGEARRGSFFGVASPGEEGGVLEGASERESDWPGEGAVFFDSGKIISGLFRGLSTRKEDDASEFFRNMVFEDFGGGCADFFRGRRGFKLFAGEDHVDFENASRQADFGFFEFFE